MSTTYEDWTDWAGDHHEQVEAEQRTAAGAECAHTDLDNQGVCVDCDEPYADWEPDEMQLDQHHGTSVAA